MYTFSMYKRIRVMYSTKPKKQGSRLPRAKSPFSCLKLIFNRMAYKSSVVYFGFVLEWINWLKHIVGGGQ